jgi:hypothetical protein
MRRAKAKTDKTKKLYSIRALKRKLWKIFSYYIRLRDCLHITDTKTHGRCITCGKKVHIKEAHAGHFIPGRNNATLFHEQATHLQCARCNLFLEGNRLMYRRAIVTIYGLGADERIERECNQTKRFTVGELELMIDTYKHKIKQLEGK